ncbi:MAG: hypothetical protein ACYSYW_09740 [Planctomycetota bacterium]
MKSGMLHICAGFCLCVPFYTVPAKKRANNFPSTMNYDGIHIVEHHHIGQIRPPPV